MRCGVDATVVRAPLSGVHYAVRHAARAVFRRAPGSCICLATDPELRHTAAHLDIPAPDLPDLLRRPLWRIPWQQLLLPGLLRRQDATGLLALAYTMPWLSSVPTALLVHDVIALDHPEWCSRPNALHMGALLRGSLRRARWLLASSTWVADRLQAHVPGATERTAVIPLAVDPLFRQPADPHERPRPYALFVGNIEPKKGVDTLLEAYARAAAEIDWDLLIVGREGWRCEAVCRRLRHWDGPGTVDWPGYVERRALPGFYAGAAAVVMPSREEGFGLPVLEAMACSAPVVHSDHPALVQTAGGAGLSFPVDDASALADRLRELAADDRLRADLAAAGRTHATARTWDHWAADVDALTGLFPAE